MKKGFTLIELLAVIIILSIVAIIAIPIILNVIDDARVSAGRSEASMIYSEINSYCATSEMKKQMGSLGVDEVDCSNKTTFTSEEINKMVNLGNAKVEKVVYSDGNLINLVIESNNHTFTLCGDKTFAIDNEVCSVTPPLIDTSGANAPELLDNMIPIKYDGSNWVYANTAESWYNYDNKEWANAVILNNGVSKSVGDTISESEVALWYVWIPRYKYQLFNVDNGSVPEQLINVIFESGTSTTGTVSCQDIDFVANPTSEVSETCTNATNGNWYTHPAFTFGDEQLTGFWVGKFANCDKVSTVTIKPGISSWRYTKLSNFYTSIQNISTTYNLSGDSHMMKNMEWGAVAYLKQSKYGLGTLDITINSSSYYTGGGNSIISYKSNTDQSTTGNVYGVYDMSGGSWEFVMGNMVDINGAFYSNGAVFSNTLDAKYYDKYAYSADSETHGRGKLGDATKETLSTFGSNIGGWYSDFAHFMNSSNSWFIRGGVNGHDTNTGIFSFNRGNGGSINHSSARAVLTS